MSSPTTPIVTSGAHDTIYESRTKILKGTSGFSTYLNLAVSRGAGWDGGQPSPTFFEVMDAIWTTIHDPWITQHGNNILSLSKFRLSEITDYHVTDGQAVPDYGDFCEMTAFGGFTSPVISNHGFPWPTDYYPDYVSVYLLKQKDASPRNINGSLRYGPVLVSWAVADDPNRLDTGLQGVLETSFNAMIADFPVTAADGGNTVDCQLVIVLKTAAIGSATPWAFTSLIDRFKCRLGLGTQNTRKKTRNTYT